MFRELQIITQSCFQAIILATVLLHGNAASENDILVITAYQEFDVLYIDGTNRSLPNGEIWNVSDSVQMDSHTRLIAFTAHSLAEPLCSGVLASSISKSILTDASFKCMVSDDVNWEQLGYDDSSWPNALEYGDNINGHSTCTQKLLFDNIDENAKWIWSQNGLFSFVVYCRGYTSLCELSSPCLNNGTCLKNDQAMCSCLPQFTGQFCEKEISTGTPEDTTYEMTTPTELTSPVSTTDTSGTTNVTTTKMSTGTPEDTTHEMTTLTESTSPVSTTDTSGTTKVTTTKISTGTPEDKTDEMTTPTESTSPVSTTDTSGTTKVTTTKISTGTPEDTTDEMTKPTESISPVSTTDKPGTTKVTTTKISTENPEMTTLTKSTSPVSTTDKPGTTKVTTTATTPTTPSATVSDSPADASQTTSITTQINMTSDGIIGNTTKSTTQSTTKSTANSDDLTTGSYGECSEQYHCNGPLEVPGSSIKHCHCPSGYLNTNDNCCLNQWWIIGLTLISAAVLIAIIIAVVSCLGCPCKSKEGKHALKTEEDTHKDISPNAIYGLPETSVGETKGLEEVAVHSDVPPIVANGKAIHPAIVPAAAVSMETSAKPAPGQPQHPHSDNDGIAYSGTYHDLLYNPLMVELLNSEVGRTFQPSLVSIPSDTQYAIKRSLSVISKEY